MAAIYVCDRSSRIGVCAHDKPGYQRFLRILAPPFSDKSMDQIICDLKGKGYEYIVTVDYSVEGDQQVVDSLTAMHSMPAINTWTIFQMANHAFNDPQFTVFAARDAGDAIKFKMMLSSI